MIDYISAVKNLQDKDKPYFGNCNLDATYSTGWEKYSLQGCEKINIWYHSAYQTLKLQGSIMYYWQGHNLTYDKLGFHAAIEHINILLNVNLWDAMLECLEYGVICKVQTKPKEYICKHTAAPKEHLTMNEKPKDKGNFKWWNDANVSLKMYDAVRNLQCKLSQQRKDAIIQSGWNPDDDYLKWEAHYLKPEVLNHGEGLLVADLMHPSWENRLKKDLYIQYKRLIPMKSIELPTDKKDLSTADIITLAYAEDCLNHNKSIQELKKALYARINSIPDNVLTKPDKDYRKLQIKKLLDKLEEQPYSKWDISEKIAEALK